MKERSNSIRKNTRFLSGLFKSSLILGTIDRFTAYIYSLIKNGFFGFLFTGYPLKSNKNSSSDKSEKGYNSHFNELRYGICRQIENSLLINTVKKFLNLLMSLRLKCYGVFLFTFAVFNEASCLAKAFLNGNLSSFLTNNYVLTATTILFASIALMLSNKNLAEAIQSSLIGKLVLFVTGYSEEELSQYNTLRGKTSVAFILGLLVSCIFYSRNPLLFVVSLIAVIWAILVIIRPEIGVFSLFVLVPYFPTMLLAAVVIFTFFSFIIKLIRGKRKISVEVIDVVIALFAVILLSGGFVSLSSSSLKPALLMVCFIIAYFLVTQLMTSRDWLNRCSIGIVISGTIEALYGLLAYYTGIGYFSNAWLDSEMFEGISGRAIGTLGNPNMLGEYLIMVIPIALVMLIGRGEGIRKIPSFFCIIIMGACLILTWSRGAWLALIVALVAFLFMWHHRSIWIIIAGIACLPILPSVLPASIMNRILSIGNMADSSTSYRVYIWRASINMLKDNFVSGIGIGEGAWGRLYPIYSYMGIEAAPHSHNLFIQIWLELGIIGFIAFLAVIFFLFQSSFTLFRKTSGNPRLTTCELSESMIRYNMDRGITEGQAYQNSSIQLRMAVVGPLASIVAVLAQGLTDYSWYNYRLFLFFWLIVGLAVAYTRNGHSYIINHEKD